MKGILLIAIVAICLVGCNAGTADGGSAPSTTPAVGADGKPPKPPTAAGGAPSGPTSGAPGSQEPQ